MNDTKIPPRQARILNVLATKPLSRLEISNKISNEYPVSKATLARELLKLKKLNLIDIKAGGRSTYYISLEHPLTRYINLDKYFAEGSQLRKNTKDFFDFNVFKNISDIFSNKEIVQITKKFKRLSKQKEKLDPAIFRREIERFTIEFSWKSSKIEGNTYSLLETEVLIKQRKEAIGHPKYEAIMILNHKKAIDYILENANEFKSLTLEKVFNLHSLLVKDLGVTTGIRKNRVAITGTNYIPLGNSQNIRKALEMTVKEINKSSFPLTKALIASCMIAYIQPFVDGNKRTARTLTNAMLIAYDLYPLSYKDVDEVEYIKSMILFYEQNNLFHLKRIFVDQFEFVANNYFLE